jgi:hypothetical protein
MFFTDHRLDAVSNLGLFLREFSQDSAVQNGLEDLAAELNAAITKTYQFNHWFTPENTRHALAQWGEALRTENLLQWREMEGGEREVNRTRVGVVMAGNLPLVGLHDFLSVFLSGHFAVVKMSSDDDKLLPVLMKVLLRFDPLYEGDWVVVDQLSDMGAVIATGSDNTARYFEYYFGRYPNIIRKNRTSVAVLTGEESEEELVALGEDIFRYYGMGCRNVNYILMHEDFDIQRFFGAIVGYSDVVNNNKYGNNYDYYRALFMLNQDDFLENGFAILRESDVLHTPVSILHYGRFQTADDVKTRLQGWDGQVQCVVGKDYIPFGQAQNPSLWDYADGVNTMSFLANL